MRNRLLEAGAVEPSPEKLFGGRSVTYDFVDLVQNGFYTRPVAPLQGLI